ncbi:MULTISPECIES: ABC transporter ATP-binding protein [unclassified Streptomyces]|uniref:ABC transporter ATP-binding protein n=1 Tax=unclassified Streptomyces TaxID=2593676 RepID=UPI000DB91081|nr:MULTISPECIES: ABC transporter ATP-binding protein [unclassified Streptomyces]MYT73477.1 ATP-binding cassette domain-containing protein [Streptomyces sp. SID8367]RAJ85009.1 oligopeptide/dipeptide ABC transporter ATP-binding protein [Streptomyces sp. PsTaAH-137]
MTSPHSPAIPPDSDDDPLLALRGFGLDLPDTGTTHGLRRDRAGAREPGRRVIVDGVDLVLRRGEAVGLVGESGSGKSMTARAVIGLTPPGARTHGHIVFDGRRVDTLSRRELRALRARRIAMVFQDPRAHVNPVHSIGDFLTEALVTERGVPRREAERRVIGLLADVGIPDGARRLRQYPHELSGGLLQRVMIASVLAAEPDLVLADEPTTALDVTAQSDVMAILDEARRERGTALLLITHDLELAAATCDRLAVMYAGRTVETQAAHALTERPRHPYSAGLLRSRPGLDERVHRLPVIPGRPVAAFEARQAGAGCSFAPRCPHAAPACEQQQPQYRELTDGARVACLRAEEVAAW